MKTPIALLAALIACPVHAQAPSPGCDSPESRQFDFWVGDWDLTYGDGKKGHNRITKIFNGCVILEEFTGAPGVQLNGRSFSVYDRNAGKWKQTWVDDSAAYLDFTGGLVDGRMILSREAGPEGKRFLQRMIFEDVRTDSLRWLWQRSDDQGATWKTLWQIDYRRRP